MSMPLAYLMLLAVGAAWGATTPLVKTATEIGHTAPAIALIHVLLNLVVIGVILAIRGRLGALPRDSASIRLYVVVGLFGIALPQWASYSATTHLPAGVTVIIVSLVPVFALPLSLALGAERFNTRRLAGVALGAIAIALLAAPGSGNLPAAGLWVWVLVAALAPLFYAIEGAIVADRRAPRAGPFQTLWAASVVALLVLAPIHLASAGPAGALHIPAARLDAIALAGLLSMAAYAGYIHMLRRHGAVFSAQVAYLVTGCGVAWAMLMLGERYPPSVWLALAALFAGLFLVQPRAQVLPRPERHHAHS